MNGFNENKDYIQYDWMAQGKATQTGLNSIWLNGVNENNNKIQYDWMDSMKTMIKFNMIEWIQWKQGLNSIWLNETRRKQQKQD